MKPSIKQGAVLVVLAVVATLIPFVNKAFHIDDPLFIWMAQQISRFPGDPYGFNVTWYWTAEPISSVMQNPPLSSYFAAVAGTNLGWSEPAMHSAFLLPAVGAILGTFFLARRFTDSPLAAALLTLFTPVFLVSATSVMCDVLVLALWVWSIECWLRGLEKNSWLLFLLASILVAAAALTKYFGISLVLLLVAFTIARDWRLWPRLLFLVIPIFVVAIYEMITKAKYGHGLLLGATAYPWTWNPTAERHIFQTFVTGLSFLGGGLISIIFYGSILKRWKLLVAGLVIFAAMVPLFYFFCARGIGHQAESITPIAGQGALFATIALGILTLAVVDLVQRRTAESLLLCLWLLGTFLFGTFLNWSVTSRALLPAAPAVAILAVRQLNSNTRGLSLWWPLLPAAAISLIVATADCKLANTAREAARQFHNQFGGELMTVWFEGHWGFQYYMEKWGAKSLPEEYSRVISGDLVIIPLNNTNTFSLPGERFAVLRHAEYAPLSFLTTMSNERSVGFYSSAVGPLPWAFVDVPMERYGLIRAR